MKNIISLVFIFGTIGTFAQDKWSAYKVEEKDLSPKNDITSICFDKQDNLWVGTWYGVYEYIDAKWVNQGNENIYVHTLFIDNQDVKWRGLVAGGVSRSNDGANWTKITDASKSQSVNVISADQKGSIWVGDWNEGLFYQNKLPDGTDKWIAYRAEDRTLGDNSVLSITSGSGNKIWFGTYHGVSLFENNTWTLFNTQNSKLPDNNIYSLCSDAKGNMWIGTGNGLAKLTGTEWTVYTNENSSLACDLILSLATDDNGNIWAGTNKGAFFFDGTTWKNFSIKNSKLPSNRVQAITVKNKKVYFGTSEGLAVYEY